MNNTKLLKSFLIKSIGIFFIGMSFGFLGCSDQPDSREFIYVGTFADSEDGGLFVYEFDRDEVQFTLSQTISDMESPGFQAIHPDGNFLYSISSDSYSDDSDYQTVSAFSINPENGNLSFVNNQSVGGRGPAHISVDPMGRFVYVSNYSSGNLSVFRIDENGSLEGPVDSVQHEGSSVHSRQQGPHVHAADPSSDGRFLYVSDLGIDKIKIYAVNQDTGELTPAEIPYFENSPGAGPRHFTFHPGGEFAYSVEELSSTVAVLSVDQNNGALEQIQRLEMLPDYFEDNNTAADIHVSPDGRFLYATNRGHDSLVIYSIDEATGMLELVGHESTRGGHPRNFLMDQNGEFVFVANRDDDNVVIFRRNESTGELTYTGNEINAPLPVCVSQLIL